MKECGSPFHDVNQQNERMDINVDAQLQEENKDRPSPRNRNPSQEKKLSWDLSGYVRDQSREISKGPVGMFSHGRSPAGTEVILWRVMSRTGTVELLVDQATEKLKIYTKGCPYTVDVVDYFDMSGGEYLSAIIVLKVSDMESAGEFFLKWQEEAIAKKNRQQGREGNTTQSKAVANVSPTLNKGSDTSSPTNMEATPNSEGSNSLIFKFDEEGNWRIKGYVIHMNKILGRGRFGTVYSGLDEKKGCSIAAKVLKGQKAEKDKLENETLELKRLSSLNHPNILHLHGTLRLEDDNAKEITLVHIFELCRGGDLKEFLVRHDPLSERQARHLMRQLVDCLCVLKANCVMHRDLKPANILLSSENVDEAVLKVADWGMAKRAATTRLTTDMALFESAVGTVAYMSPERLKRDTYDFQAEVWAAGVIMYELLFARHPYLYPAAGVRTPDDLLHAITRAEELEMTGPPRESKSGDGQKPLSPSPHLHPHDQQQKQQKQQQQQQEQEQEEQQLQSPAHVHLSHDCYELMRRMLDADSQRRYTIEQVAAHRWFNPDKTDEAIMTPTAATPPLPLSASLPIEPTAAETKGTTPATSTDPPQRIPSELNIPTKEKDTEPMMVPAPGHAAVQPVAASPAQQTLRSAAVAGFIDSVAAAAAVGAAADAAAVTDTAADAAAVDTAAVTDTAAAAADTAAAVTDASASACAVAAAAAAVTDVDVYGSVPRGRGFPHRQHIIYQALRSYLHVLRHDVLEEETDPARGLVLLAYAWELLRVAVRTARIEETSADERVAAALGDAALRIPEDVRQYELYIQDAAQRRRRCVPVSALPRPSSDAAIDFLSVPIDAPMDPTGALPKKASASAYPTAQALLFQRAIALVRGAATEELMLSGDSAQDGHMDETEEESQMLAGRRRAYERAMAILHLLLQQAVVRGQTLMVLPGGISGSEAEEDDNLQVLSVPLVPFANEADKRTIQALLHSVEKHYHRIKQVK